MATVIKETSSFKFILGGNEKISLTLESNDPTGIFDIVDATGKITRFVAGGEDMYAFYEWLKEQHGE